MYMVSSTSNSCLNQCILRSCGLFRNGSLYLRMHMYMLSFVSQLILAKRGKGGLLTPRTGSFTKQKNVVRPISSLLYDLAYVSNCIARN